MEDLVSKRRRFLSALEGGRSCNVVTAEELGLTRQWVVKYLQYYCISDVQASLAKRGVNFDVMSVATQLDSDKQRGKEVQDSIVEGHKLDYFKCREVY